MTIKQRSIFIGLLLMFAISAQAALPVRVGDQAVPSLAPLVEAASPAVVNIRVRQTVSAGQPFADDAFRRFFGIPEGPPPVLQCMPIS